MRLSLLFATIMLVTSCSHDGIDNQSAGLLGKWKLISSAISIGGPVTWQDADPNNPSYVEFTVRGKIIFSDKSNENKFDYTKTEEGKFSVTVNGASVIYWYSIEGNELTLDGGGCIEQCSRKYKKVKGGF